MQKFSKLIKHAVRKEMEAKGRPDTLFKQKFYDVREKVKGIKDNWEKEVGEKLEKLVLDDLKSKNVSVIEHKFSLGRYRGSRFVTSFKLKVQVKDQKAAESLVNYLKGKYSPKWRINKISDDGVVELNLRGKNIMDKEKVARELLDVTRMLKAAWWSSRDAEKEVRKALDKAWESADDWRRDARTQDSPEAEKIMEKVQEHIEDAMKELKNVRDL